MKDISPDETIIKKEQELNRLIARAKSVPSTEIKFLRIAYEQISKLLVDLQRFDEAIEYYLKLEEFSIQIGDQAELGTIYNDIGFVYSQKKDLSKSLEYYQRSVEIRSKEGNNAALGTTYNNIGGILDEYGDKEEALSYYQSAEQLFLSSNYKKGLGATYNNIGGYYIFKEDWTKALEFLLKSEIIRKETEDNQGLAITFFNIGFVYFKLNYWNDSLDYLGKSEKLLIEIGDKVKRKELQQIVGNIYNSLAFEYSNKGDFNKAVAYHHQAERIRYEIEDYSGLVQTLYNTGMEWLRIKNAEKAINYFILAGYIAKKNDMTFELQQMDWAIKEIIKKHGESNFMEIGETHYRSWVQHAELEKKSTK